MHVLVVDDDRAIRSVVRDLLEDEGYTVTTAPDGPAALAHLWLTDTPMVVLADQRLPGLSGAQGIETYLQAGSPACHREFILLTGAPAAATPLSVRVPVVEKPFHLDALLEAVAGAAARLEQQQPEEASLVPVATRPLP